MRKRNAAAVAGLTLAAALGGAAIANATLSAGTGYLLCFPSSGPVLRPTNGACPSGYSKAYVGTQAVAASLTARVNSMSQFILAKYPFTLTTSLVVNGGNPHQLSYQLVTANMLPGTKFVSSWYHNGAYSSQITNYTVTADGKFPPQGGLVNCVQGDTWQLKASAYDSVGTYYARQSPVVTCP